MSKLRVVRDRKQETSNFDQDLRGLGGTSLLSNEYPWVFLAVKNATEHIGQARELFGVSVKLSEDRTTHILFKTGKTQTHKEKTLELFVAGLFLLSKSPQAEMFLGQMSILAERTKGTDSSQIAEDRSEDYLLWKSQPSVLQTTENIKLYLSHAGINLDSCEVKATEVHKIVEASQAVTQTAQRKTS